jgi:hypothetical protein
MTAAGLVLSIVWGIIILGVVVFAVKTYIIKEKPHYFIEAMNLGGVFVYNTKVPYVKGQDFKQTLRSWLTQKGIDADVEYRADNVTLRGLK